MELHRASFHRKKLGSQQPHLVASTMPAFAVCVYAAALDASFRRRPRGNSLSGVASSFERAAATAAKRSTIAIRGAEAQRASPRARHKDPQDKRPMASLLHLRRTSLSLWSLFSHLVFLPSLSSHPPRSHLPLVFSPFFSLVRRDLRARTYARGRCLLNFHGAYTRHLSDSISASMQEVVVAAILLYRARVSERM